MLIKLSSNIFDRKTSIDEALVKQAKLELLKDLYDSKIVGNFYYYNNSYNLLEEKKVLHGIERGKIIILNYAPEHRKLGDNIDRIKDGIINKNNNFDQNFQLSPSTPSLKAIGKTVKLGKQADVPYTI